MTKAIDGVGEMTNVKVAVGEMTIPVDPVGDMTKVT